MTLIVPSTRFDERCEASAQPAVSVVPERFEPRGADAGRSSELSLTAGDVQPVARRRSRYLGVFAGLIFLPLFFQLSGTIYRDPASLIGPFAMASRLPIPIAMLLVLSGIAAVSFGRFGHRQTLIAPAVWLGCLGLAAWVSTGDWAGLMQENRIGIHFWLPALGLCLGQALASASAHRAFLMTGGALCGLIVPAQLVLTWLKGTVVLSSDLMAFRIYQHLQYVPPIIVAGVLLGMFALWERPAFRGWLIALWTMTGCYATASMSMTAMGLVLVGGAIFAARILPAGRQRLGWMLITIVPVGAYLTFARSAPVADETDLAFMQKFTLTGRRALAVSAAEIENLQTRFPWLEYVPPNLQERVVYWEAYLSEVIAEPRALLFGRANGMAADRYPSAHNYYLDLWYHFGALGAVPVVTLMLWTLYQSYLCRTELTADHGLLALAVVVCYLLLVDNMLKVSLRTSYAGIITSCLWGVLLGQFAARRQFRCVTQW